MTAPATPSSPRAGKLLTPSEASEHTGLGIQTLANMRNTGRGPAFFKISRFVRYDENDLDEWMRSRRFTSTSQEVRP
ncbi:helix-turn-helix domain-containing protein [Novosphingobium resinovorum]|uniref:helix-turn-helix transcriptional regulator n=1 Tax=Novosphingobium resinovorum TaxID=158500 RepID=UPI0012DC1C3B